MLCVGCGTDIKVGESDSFVSCPSRLTVDTVCPFAMCHDDARQDKESGPAACRLGVGLGMLLLWVW